MSKEKPSTKNNDLSLFEELYKEIEITFPVYTKRNYSVYEYQENGTYTCFTLDKLVFSMTVGKLREKSFEEYVFYIKSIYYNKHNIITQEEYQQFQADAQIAIEAMNSCSFENIPSFSCQREINKNKPQEIEQNEKNAPF